MLAGASLRCASHQPGTAPDLSGPGRAGDHEGCPQCEGGQNTSPSARLGFGRGGCFAFRIGGEGTDTARDDPSIIEFLA